MLVPGVEHQNIRNKILNTAKMHDAQIIHFFHQEATPLNCDISIHTKAAREIAIQREKEQR